MAKSKAETNGKATANAAGCVELPEGWAISLVRDFLEMKYGKGLKKSGRVAGVVPVYGSNGQVGSHNKAVTVGPTIIVGRKGTVGAVNFSDEKCWPIDTTYFIDEANGCELRYLYYGLKTLGMEGMDTSTAIPGLSRDDAYACHFPVAPLAEQKRIVAKVEALLERVNQARERLARVPDLLKRFRQSVLAAACSGQLTADWREVNPKSNSEAKPQPNSNEYDAELLRELPETWCWTEIEEVGNVKSGKRLPKGEKLVDYVTPFPYVVAGQLKNGTVIEKNQKYLTPEIQKKIKRYTINAGDVYITIVGACIGDAGVVPLQKDGANLTENAAKITNFDGIQSGYLSVWLRSLAAQQVINQMIMSGSQGKLALKRIKVIPVPLPSVAEQEEIIQRVDALFEIAKRIEQRISTGTNRTEKITQSILAKAFAGELVETEADLAHREGRDYEPASVLLERITAERVGVDEKNKKAKKPMKRKSAKRKKAKVK